MAASALRNDYPHRFYDLLYAQIKTSVKKPPRLRLVRIKNEPNLDGWEHLKNHNADLIIIQLGENYRGKPEDFAGKYRKLIRDIRTNPSCIIVCFSKWADKQIDKGYSKEIRQIAKEGKCIFVDLSEISSDPRNYAKAEKRFQNGSVNWHPGDRGMNAIAQRAVEVVLPVLREWLAK